MTSEPPYTTRASRATSTTSPAVRPELRTRLLSGNWLRFMDYFEASFIAASVASTNWSYRYVAPEMASTPLMSPAWMSAFV